MMEKIKINKYFVKVMDWLADAHELRLKGYVWVIVVLALLIV